MHFKGNFKDQLLIVLEIVLKVILEFLVIHIRVN